MVFRSCIRAALVACLALPAPAAMAHHSVSGQFDASKVVEWTGVISKVDWVNPHIYIHLDVKDDTGNVTTWRLSTAPPAFMRKAGLTKAMIISNGETVTATGIVARDGTAHLGWLYRIHYPDGHEYQFSGAR